MYSLLDNSSTATTRNHRNQNEQSSNSSKKYMLITIFAFILLVGWFSSSSSDDGGKSSNTRGGVSTVTVVKQKETNDVDDEFLEGNKFGEDFDEEAYDNDEKDLTATTTTTGKQRGDDDDWEPNLNQDVYAEELSDANDDNEEEQLPKDFVGVGTFDVDQDDYLSKSANGEEDNDVSSPNNKGQQNMDKGDDQKKPAQNEETIAEPDVTSESENEQTSTNDQGKTKDDESNVEAKLDQTKDKPVEPEVETTEEKKEDSPADTKSSTENSEEQDNAKPNLDEDEIPDEKPERKVPIVPTPVQEWKSTSNGECPPVENSKSRVLHFIEIPKTLSGGVTETLNAWGKKLVPPAKIFRTTDGVPDSCPPQSFEANILIGRGFGYCPKIQMRKQPELITMSILRGPIARLGVMFDSAPERFRDERAKFGSLRSAFSVMVKEYDKTTNVIEPGEQTLRSFGSSQARYLCGYECVGPHATITDDGAILAKAKENLAKLDIIGLAEELTTLAWQVKYFVPHLAPKVFKQFPKEKENTKKSIIDEETKLILQKWAWVDKALYAEAKSMYERRTQLAKRCLGDNLD
jgi:hypothetical protein